MNVSKIVTGIIDVAKNSTKIADNFADDAMKLVDNLPTSKADDAAKVVTNPFEASISMAESMGRQQVGVSPSSTIKKIDIQDQIEGLPEYIYHMTDPDAAKKIVDSGGLKVQKFESRYSAVLEDGVDDDNQLRGIYTIGKDNFLSKWADINNEEYGLTNASGALIQMVQNGHTGVSVIKIPTSSLDKSKLVFRPYEETFIAAVEGDRTFIKGLPISELSKYQDSALEFVYQDDIPVDKFASITTKEIGGNLDEVTGLYDNFEIIADKNETKRVANLLFGDAD